MKTDIEALGLPPAPPEDHDAYFRRIAEQFPGSITFGEAPAQAGVQEQREHEQPARPAILAFAGRPPAREFRLQRTQRIGRLRERRRRNAWAQRIAELCDRVKSERLRAVIESEVKDCLRIEQMQEQRAPDPAGRGKQ